MDGLFGQRTFRALLQIYWHQQIRLEGQWRWRVEPPTDRRYPCAPLEDEPNHWARQCGVPRTSARWLPVVWRRPRAVEVPPQLHSISAWRQGVHSRKSED